MVGLLKVLVKFTENYSCRKMHVSADKSRTVQYVKRCKRQTLIVNNFKLQVEYLNIVKVLFIYNSSSSLK